MAGLRYPAATKKAVLALGARGLTYEQIREKYPVPKSTLSVWFTAARNGRVIDKSKQLEHLKRARLASALVKSEQRKQRLAAASSSASRIANTLPINRADVCKTMLAMLYWAEGGKQDGNLKFTNTDPALARLFLTLMRMCYEIDESRLRVALQVHYYHRRGSVLEFWSSLLEIPESQFWKIYVKKRGVGKRFRKNFQGICNIHYSSSSIQRELLALGEALASKLEKQKLPSFNG